MSSYYKGRKQSVVINGDMSESCSLVTGFPQGSVLGPFSYPVYTAPLFNIARRHGIKMYMYADDSQLILNFDPKCYNNQTFAPMNDCINEIKNWMNLNHLKMNDAKTEVILIGTTSSLKTMNNLQTFHVGNEDIVLTDSARNLGVTIDKSLKLDSHVHNIIRICYHHLRRISKIRQYITEEAAATLARSLVLSRLDYANAILIGLPETLLNKLQLVQNNAARMIYRKRKSHSATELLKQLHWLPIRYRIQYKILVLVFKSMNEQSPKYIQELIEQ